MALTRDFKDTVVERAQRDRAFARAMLNEAASLLLIDEPGPDASLDLLNNCLFRGEL